MKLFIEAKDAGNRAEAVRLAKENGITAVSVRQTSTGWNILGEVTPQPQPAAQERKDRMDAQGNEFQM